MIVVYGAAILAFFEGRKPTIASIARYLQLLHETTRRYLKTIVDLGLIPVPRTIYVPDAPWRLSLRRAGFSNARATSAMTALLLVGGVMNLLWVGLLVLLITSGEGHSHRTPDRSPCWHSSARGWSVVIVDDGNVLTANHCRRCLSAASRRPGQSKNSPPASSCATTTI